MNNKLYFKIATIIVWTFAAVIAMSFVGDYCRDFFGDWKCEGAVRVQTSPDHYWTELKGCHYADCGVHDPTWHWGYRHWMFFACGFFLFILNIVRVINIIDKTTD